MLKRKRASPKQNSEQAREKEAYKSVNAMTTFELSNHGIERRYNEPNAFDASINSQFEAMESEANLTPDRFVWTGILFNHSQTNARKTKRINLF